MFFGSFFFFIDAGSFPLMFCFIFFSLTFKCNSYFLNLMVSIGSCAKHHRDFVIQSFFNQVEHVLTAPTKRTEKRKKCRAKHITRKFHSGNDAINLTFLEICHCMEKDDRINFKRKEKTSAKETRKYPNERRIVPLQRTT